MGLGKKIRHFCIELVFFYPKSSFTVVYLSVRLCYIQLLTLRKKGKITAKVSKVSKLKSVVFRDNTGLRTQ